MNELKPSNLPSILSPEEQEQHRQSVLKDLEARIPGLAKLLVTKGVKYRSRDVILVDAALFDKLEGLLEQRERLKSNG